MLSCSVAQSGSTLYDPMDCSLPGSSVHGIFPARILEWVAIYFSRRSSWPRDQTWVSCVSCIVEGFFTCWANGYRLNPTGMWDRRQICNLTALGWLHNLLSHYGAAIQNYSRSSCINPTVLGWLVILSSSPCLLVKLDGCIKLDVIKHLFFFPSRVPKYKRKVQFADKLGLSSSSPPSFPHTHPSQRS